MVVSPPSCAKAFAFLSAGSLFSALTASASRSAERRSDRWGMHPSEVVTGGIGVRGCGLRGSVSEF